MKNLARTSIAMAALVIAPGLVTALTGVLGAPDTDPVDSFLAGVDVEKPILDLTHAIDMTETLAFNAPIPAAATGIGPGTKLIITMPGGTFGCTANFIWQAGSARYLGAAGHCFIPANAEATHGPNANYNPALTSVRACVSGCNWGGQTGFIITGTLVTLGPVVYARQTQGGVDVGNDFGIVTIPTSLQPQMRPSMPVWTGPTTVATLGIGTIGCHYGNGVAVGESFPTMARAGAGMGQNVNSWLMNSPSAPGDSGSAVQTCTADAAGGFHGVGGVGILTHLVVGSAGVVAGTTINKAQTMATQAGLSITPVF